MLQVLLRCAKTVIHALPYALIHMLSRCAEGLKEDTSAMVWVIDMLEAADDILRSSDLAAVTPHHHVTPGAVDNATQPLTFALPLLKGLGRGELGTLVAALLRQVILRRGAAQGPEASLMVQRAIDLSLESFEILMGHAMPMRDSVNR